MLTQKQNHCITLTEIKKAGYSRSKYEKSASLALQSVSYILLEIIYIILAYNLPELLKNHNNFAANRKYTFILMKLLLTFFNYKKKHYW
jgi:hypothetical protein